jgi:tetratricopeptide (TPR) repeat protein
MFKQVPIEGWLLLAIAAAAYTPAHYVYKYIARRPSSRRDITQPAEDLIWRRSAQLAHNLAILGALAALAVFIFTPAAHRFANSPSFWPILMLVCGTWALVTVARGFSIGRVQPFVRGVYHAYERQSQPRRFWASMGWNACFGCFCLWLAFQMNEQALVLALEGRCYDAKNALSPQEELSACNQLIGRPGGSDVDKARLVAWRGSAYSRLGDYRHAMIDYSRAVRLDPDESSWHFNLGLTRERLGDRASAVADYSAAVRVAADNADAYLNRGLIFLDNGKFDQAVADFTRASELKPNDPVPVANRGIAYAWMRDQDRAERDFVAVRALDPSNPVVLRGEALLSMNRGDINAAVDHLSAALNQDPGDSWSLAMRAKAYRQLGEYEKMRADASALQRLSKNPENARHR